MLLHEMVERSAHRAPDDLALVSDAGRWTFAALRDGIRSTAAGLADVAREGDRVAILAENRAEYVVALSAVPAAGAVLVPLNHRLHPDEWAEALARTGATTLVGERALLDDLGSDRLGPVRTVLALDDAGPGERAWAEIADPGAAGVAPTARDPDAPAWIISTSGTTGRPKGAVLTHTSLAAGVESTARCRPVAPDDVYAFPFPLCHVAAYNVLHHHRQGRPVVLLHRFRADAFLDAVVRHGVTSASLAPTMIDMLCAHPDLPAPGTSTLRSLGYGAAPLPPAVLRRAAVALAVDFAQGYGMTELSGNAAFLGPDEHRRGLAGDDRMLRAAGFASPLVELRVVDDDLVDVRPGTPGEIVVRGDQVTPGYWRDPAASAAAFAGGWFRTGDLGTLDADGLLSVVDRKKDVIVTGGENVASREVEDVLHQHPAVADVAVIGVPDERWGEDVCAVVVPRHGTTIDADELVAHVRRHLAGYKKPRHVVVVDELPRNAAGKVLKARLRDEIPRRLEGTGPPGPP